jgi:hypothetical protein
MMISMINGSAFERRRLAERMRMYSPVRKRTECFSEVTEQIRISEAAGSEGSQ